VSLSFDDARTSQVERGLVLLKKEGVRVTFFVNPEHVKKRLAGWKQAVADGHEIGNHSLAHSCTGNYPAFLQNALENYDLRMMAHELDGANDQIQKLLGVKAHPPCLPLRPEVRGKRTGREKLRSAGSRTVPCRTGLS
jgi:peptidoglycan/xylan/chitin deacetylase (PgdA/CDA1 family)